MKNLIGFSAFPEGFLNDILGNNKLPVGLLQNPMGNDKTPDGFLKILAEKSKNSERSAKSSANFRRI